MALTIHMHFEPNGDACDSSPQGVVIPNSEREINLDGQLGARLEVDCGPDNTVRIEYSTDGQQTWEKLLESAPPVVDSCSRTEIFPIPAQIRTVVWVRAVLVGAQAATCRMINLETLDAA